MYERIHEERSVSFGGSIISRLRETRRSTLGDDQGGARIDAVTRGDVSEFSDSGIQGIREDPLMKPFSWTDLPLSRGWERESFLYRVRSISDQTFQLRISARSAIDPPSNLQRNSRSPVVRWTSSESPPFPIPCRAYDLDLVSLSRSSTYSIHGLDPRASIEFRIGRALRKRDANPAVVGVAEFSLTADHFSRPEVGGRWL